jgi:hypothetical protein
MAVTFGYGRSGQLRAVSSYDSNVSLFRARTEWLAASVDKRFSSPSAFGDLHRHAHERDWRRYGWHVSPLFEPLRGLKAPS